MVISIIKKSIALFLLSVISLAFYSTPVVAAPLLSFSTDQQGVVVSPGQTVSFTGIVTNRTDQSLDSTDLFFNFSNFDITGLNPVQDLGSDLFTIRSFTFVSGIKLFTIGFADQITAGNFSIDVSLQDVFGNVSELMPFAFRVAGDDSPPGPGSSVPEPSTVLLIMAGLAVAMLSRRQRLRS